ncbi:MAG: hypothetical protein K0U98_14985 [Deltaproteobacteria bacterium]|nr:hypothetical protein [Deltaproteobacteria bacterium]
MISPKDLGKRIKALHHEPFGHTDLHGLAGMVRQARSLLGLPSRGVLLYLEGLLRGDLPIPEGPEVEALEIALGIEPGELLSPEPPPSLRQRLEQHHEKNLQKLEALRISS